MRSFAVDNIAQIHAVSNRDISSHCVCGVDGEGVEGGGVRQVSR